MTITIIADHDTTEAITRHLRWLFVVTAEADRPGCNWDSDPLVWVIEFKRIESESK